MNPGRFPSKRDTWIVAVLGVAVLVLLAALWVAALRDETTAGELVFCTVLVVSTIAFILWVVFATDYTFDGAYLRVRSGPFRTTIPTAKIWAVSPTRNPLSSPALSLDRLLIEYDGSKFGVMISPEDRARFLDILESNAPHLKRDGERFVRR